ncbi:MAG TPA: phytanoyl-CoA dioxygenase family protein [Planctomycetota bacterium]|nr:phytanoyl-CoA dioxygenase family protein [Planctomycetota bacterium]
MPKTLEDHAQELRTQGYTIVEGVLSREQIDATNEALESIFEREKEIGPIRGWHNQTYKVAYMLPQKHALFRSFCQNERLLPLMQLLLGKNCILASLNGLTMTPGGQSQQLHIDQNETVPGNVLYINALTTLDDFTKENGCTRVVPYSQNRIFKFKQMDHAAAEKEVVYLEAPAGSVIAYNGGLWHAGSQNRTNKPRRAIHPFFCKPWCRPQWDYTRSLTPDVVATLTEEQKRLFGFFAKAGWYDPVENIEKRER